MTDALRDDRDQFEAIAEQHATNIKDVIKAEHEHTRATNAQEAESTRQLGTARHDESIMHQSEEHVKSRAIVFERSAYALAVAEESGSKFTGHISASLNEQTDVLSDALSATQTSLHQHVTSTTTDATEDITH